MSILTKIKDFADNVFSPQQMDDNAVSQAPSSGMIQGSLGGYRQPMNQLQGGQLPIFTNRLSVRQPDFGRIQPRQQIVFNPQDIFQEGLDFDEGSRYPRMEYTQFEEEQPLQFR